MSFIANNPLKPTESSNENQFTEVAEFWFCNQSTCVIILAYHFTSCIPLGKLFTFSFFICKIQTLIRYPLLSIKIIFNFTIKFKKSST